VTVEKAKKKLSAWAFSQLQPNLDLNPACQNDLDECTQTWKHSTGMVVGAMGQLAG